MYQYLDFCHDADFPDDFNHKTYQFLNNHFNSNKIILASHTPDLNALSLLKANCEINTSELYNRLSKIKINPLELLDEDDLFYYIFSGNDFKKTKITLFIISKNTAEQSKRILKCWQKGYGLLLRNMVKTRLETYNDSSNLISQLLHDVNSLTELNKNNPSEEIQIRNTYLKKVNRNLLFYMREFDLFKNEIAVDTLVKDSLLLIGIHEEINISLASGVDKIVVDIELMATAFNEIVKNAIKATDSDFNKVTINIYREISRSPFIKEDWIVFEITDRGKGITKDFLTFIKNPFFTTDKYDGHSGFGLSNADKIVKAHDGFINIDAQDNWTSVKIYLPEL